MTLLNYLYKINHNTEITHNKIRVYKDSLKTFQNILCYLILLRLLTPILVSKQLIVSANEIYNRLIKVLGALYITIGITIYLCILLFQMDRQQL